jgi:long-chain acyl-CoA synthetase
MNSPVENKTLGDTSQKYRLVDTSRWQQHKDDVAIIDTSQTPPQRITYEDLNNSVERMAAILSLDATTQKSQIGILLENTTNFVVTLLAIFRSGHIATPISLKSTQRHIDSIAQNCAFIICSNNTSQLLSKKMNYKLVEKLISNSQTNLKPGSFTNVDIDEALILYTSGSTANPKGIIHTHSGLGWKIQTAAQESLNLNPTNNQAINYLASPMYHMNGLSALLVMLNAFRTIVVTPTFIPEQAARIIQEQNVTSIIAVPAMIAQIIALNTQQTYTTVLSIRLGSAPLTENLLNSILKSFPAAIIRNNYGLTEVGPNLFGEHPTLSRPKLSVGYPRNQIDYRIVEGILQIKSPSQFKTNSSGEAPKLTADGYYITNDLFRKDDNGFYFYLGRADDMIVCGGENIYLHKIDTVLESHPAVQSSLTIALTDEIKGKKPYTFIIAKQHIQEAELVNYLQEYFTRNTMPRKIWFIDEIPLTELGKVSRKKLETLAQDNLKTES